MSRLRGPRVLFVTAGAVLAACFNPSGGAGSATETESTATKATASTGSIAPSTASGPTTTAGSGTTAGADLGGQDLMCPALTADDFEDGLGGVVIRGEPWIGGTGIAVRGIGDFDDDGADDIIVRALPIGASECAPTTNWRNYIVRGKDDTSSVELASATDSEFVTSGDGRYIDGMDGCDDPLECMNRFGVSLDGAGDLDRDGLADIIVGAPLTNAARGRVYVLHGRDDVGNLSAAAAVDDPVDSVLEGSMPAQEIGQVVAGLGAIDDADDVPDFAFIEASRAVQVRYGRPPVPVDPEPVLPGSLLQAANGYTLLPPSDAATIKPNLQGGHDFTGDGLPDFFISVTDGGAHYLFVISRRRDQEEDLPSVRVDALLQTQEATRIACPEICTLIARFVGDINGDGRSDIAAGDPAASEAFVFFGQEHLGQSVDVASLTAAQGFRITGAGLTFGTALAGADLNGDGIHDLVIGEPFFGGFDGRVHVALGKKGLSGVDLADVAMGRNGFVIDGPSGQATLFGMRLDRAGRFNADDFDDLVIGAPAVNYLSCMPMGFGRAYVVFGGSCGR